MDYRKAFDLIDHSLLIMKLKGYSISASKGKDIAIKWYAKSQSITVNGDDRADIEDKLKSVASMAKTLSDAINSEEQTMDRSLENTLEALYTQIQTLKEELSSKMSSVTDILLVHSKELREL